MEKLSTHRWTREAYERMVECEILTRHDRVELLNGEIVGMPPQKSVHAAATQLTQQALSRAFGAGFTVRSQLPLALDPSSEPEPDIAVVRGNPRDYVDAHPTHEVTVLVVEVADSTLQKDRSLKRSLYARTGIGEYWIVNLTDRQVEVYRNPGPKMDELLGFTYAESRICKAGSRITPVEAPSAGVAVDDLLP